MFVYRELSIRDLPKVFLKASMTTGLVMIVIASAGIFAWILANEGLPIILRDLLLSVSQNRYVVLLIILALMLAIGCVMEIVAAGIIMIPVLYPIARFFGFDDVHFGLLIMISMAIGAVTPPVGVTLYVTLGIADTSLTSVTRYLWPMILVLILVLVLVALVPPLATAIPRAFFN
jgi:C4-dicarboxylate transporter DctM subunit